MNPMLRFCAAVIAMLVMATSFNGADAQERRRTTPISPLALVLAPPPPNTGPLTVTSPDFDDFGHLEKVYLHPVVGGESRSPGLAWSEGPAGTQSYVMIAESVDDHRPDPTVHWIVYDIPADAHELPQGIPTDPIIANPAGAMNGLEATGTSGYRGPDTPEGAIHPYYFQVFALDTKLGLDPAQADRLTVIAAMKGHVLAAGQIVAVHRHRTYRPEPNRTTPISPLALVLAPPPPSAAPLTVTSPNFENFGHMESVFMQPDAGGENRAPGLAWSEGPAGTQSYVVIYEGVGEHRPDPTVHWIVYDIPADAHELPQGIPTDPIIANPVGAMNGLEATGTPGYRGTDTPEGAIHPYYFQVFALDTKLGLDPAQADRLTVIDAMKGHVLAAGQIVVVHNNR